jgi:hypothetical protein
MHPYDLACYRRDRRFVTALMMRPADATNAAKGEFEVLSPYGA